LTGFRENPTLGSQCPDVSGFPIASVIYHPTNKGGYSLQEIDDGRGFQRKVLDTCVRFSPFQFHEFFESSRLSNLDPVVD